MGGKASPGYMAAYKQKRKEEDPEYVRKATLRQKYGITIEQYDSLYEAQHGCCAICGEHRERLDVDHCHATKAIRGLLCGNCNRAIGLFRDDPERLIAAAEYLGWKARP